MSNHYQIALRAAEVPLWRSMASIQGLRSKMRWAPAEDDQPVSPRESGGYVEYLGRSTAPERPLLTAADYMGRAFEALGVDVEELASRRREPSLRELRELVAVLDVEKYGQRVREIAEMLEKNPGSVSRWVSAAAERRLVDSGFAERLGKLDQALLGDV